MVATSQSQRSACLIAVIDDDRPVRESLCNLLEAAAYSAVSFDSAESFLDRNRTDDIACVLLDVQLPGLDGFGLQERLWRARQAIPVIFMSSYCDAEIHERAMRAGAIAFLRKPVDVEALLGHLKQATAAHEPPS